MTTLVADFTAPDGERFWLGLLLALLLHAAIIVAFYLSIKYAPPAAPTRIAVSVSQLQPEPEPIQPVEPKTTPVEPTKTVDSKPLLTAQNDRPEQVLVPEQTQEEPEVEPKPEPIPSKPKPIEQPKHKPEPKPKPKPKPKPEPEPKPDKVVEPKVEKKPPEQPPETQLADSAEPTPQQETDTVSESVTTAENSRADSQSDSQGGAKDTPNKGNVSTDEVDRNDAWKGYGQLLYAMVSKNKQYPQLAIRRNLEGMVMVSVKFEHGKLVGIKIVKPGSGHAVLDRAARKMLKKAVEAIPIKGDLVGKSFSVVVPVDFRLTS